MGCNASSRDCGREAWGGALGNRIGGATAGNCGAAPLQSRALGTTHLARYTPVPYSAMTEIAMARMKVVRALAGALENFLPGAENEAAKRRHQAVLKAALWDKGVGPLQLGDLSEDMWRQVLTECNIDHGVLVCIRGALQRALPSPQSDHWSGGGASAAHSSTNDAWEAWNQPTSAAAAAPPGLVPGTQPAPVPGTRGLTLTPGPFACAFHTVPAIEGAWFHEPLEQAEVESLADGLWDAEAVKRVVNSMYSSLGPFPPELEKVIWTDLDSDNLFWKGLRMTKQRCFFWMRGNWPGGKTSRQIEMGCLRCGFRTPYFYLWGPCAEADDKPGAEVMMEILKCMFNTPSKRARTLALRRT